MKKILFISLFFFLVFQSYSQPVEKKMLLKNEFYLSYGAGSVQEITGIFTDMFISIFSFSNTTIKTIGLPGPIILGFKRVLFKRVGVGILASYTNYNSEVRKQSDNSLLFSSHLKFYTLMARADLYYVINEWVQMYSGASLGFVKAKGSTDNANSTPSKPSEENALAYQINAFSIRVGKSFGGFLELGYGFNGMINLGFSYKF